MLDRTDAVAWLQKFGYIAKDLVPDNLEFDAALKKMQGRYKLKQDGHLGPITSAAMGLFRCGVPDIMRIVVEGTTDCMWQKDKIQYYHSPNFRFHGHSKAESAAVIQTAAECWMQHIPLKISRTKYQSQADVSVAFGRGRKHGFDGVGNTLAWAHMPCLDLDVALEIMFDLDEPWSKDPKAAAGVLSMAVAVHEWGHILGLDHYDDESGVMAPFYNPQIWTPQAVDIQRIQAIYGEKEQGAITVSVAGTMTTDPGGAINLDLTMTN